MSRVAERVCRTKDFTQFSRERCVGFEVHKPKVFFPIDGPAEWWKFFYENSTEIVMNKLKDSMAVHTWNAHSRDHHQTLNEPKSAYSILGKKHCPVVISLNLNFFEIV